ncbi:NADH dehydrogenase [ubiquinone] 1 beta subcomplex subunit 5, mitochondrial [Halyomorpha halys]|uniref:NADH dehydrogenase [ubiquinone] 1 beta subcomplex subunit 5, mitochondrial n=1 Tax=Halyomorpha halys TaxID=286706 RepID=UPI0006D4F492|nr:NADH dehydrogenase [ubiquinone] 1 beta subcomplex subunit 5, mitochondrial [Halyomorpha halys]
MAIWSSLRTGINRLLTDGAIKAPYQLRLMSGGHHKVMEIRSTRFQWQKMKDLVHFYVMLGLIPVGLLIFYSNVFIGPGTLREIPEDYTPKHWEYYKHPITRFLARYVYSSHQEAYEKNLHRLYEEDEKMKMRKLQEKILDLMDKNKDYQSYYYIPVDGKYHRIVRKEAEEIAEIGGFVPPKLGPPV